MLFIDLPLARLQLNITFREALAKFGEEDEVIAGIGKALAKMEYGLDKLVTYAFTGPSPEELKVYQASAGSVKIASVYQTRL